MMEEGREAGQHLDVAREDSVRREVARVPSRAARDLGVSRAVPGLHPLHGVPEVPGDDGEQLLGGG